MPLNPPPIQQMIVERNGFPPIVWLKWFESVFNLTKTGKFTCNASATSTIVTDKCSPNSVILISPLTSDAATLQAGTYIVPALGSFTVNHSSNASTLREFSYVIIG